MTTALLPCSIAPAALPRVEWQPQTTSSLLSVPAVPLSRCPAAAASSGWLPAARLARAACAASSALPGMPHAARLACVSQVVLEPSSTSLQGTPLLRSAQCPETSPGSAARSVAVSAAATSATPSAPAAAGSRSSETHAVAGDESSKAASAAAHGALVPCSEGGSFELMLAELRHWRELYQSTNVPRRVHDNPVLGEWVHRQRKLHKEGRLPAQQVAALEEAGVQWVVNTMDAKWYAMLHEARRYKEAHGSGCIPADYVNPAEPNWVEAARWLARQDQLYAKQKLSARRLKMINSILGVYFRRPKQPKPPRI